MTTNERPDPPRPRAPGAQWPTIETLADLRAIADEWFSNPTPLKWDEIRFVLDGIRRVTEDHSLKLKFGDLTCGDHFISWPLPGDNSGHGGYLGAHRLFQKTGELTAKNGLDVESSMNAKMDVIKILLR